MKTFMIAVASVVGALTFSTTASAQTVVDSDTIRLCADKGAFGWVVTGVNSTTRDWRTNKALGEAIGDGNCQDGWVISSTVDPRIDYAPASKLAGIDTSSVATQTGVSVDVETAVTPKGITASYQGYAPPRLFNVSTGAMKNIVGYDNRGRALYRVLNGNQAGTIQKWTEAKLLDRSVRDGCKQSQRSNCHRLRYDAAVDTTTTVKDFDVETTDTFTYTKTRTFCPSVWTYNFVAPTGEAVGTVQGHVGECVDKRYTVTRKAVSNSTRSVTNVVVGDKYVSN